MAENVSITAGSGTVIGADEATIDGVLQKVQRMKLYDGTAGGTTPAIVLSNGSLQIQGYQPAASTYSAVTTVSNQTALAVAGLNIATLTLRTFTGTTPSITFKLQASDDGGTNWIDLQGINNTTGQVGVSWIQAAALTAGTAGYSCDYAIGAYTHVRVAITAISGASATAAFGLAAQSMPYEPSPGVILNGYDGTINQLVNVTAKAIQGTRGLAVQDLKDSGRVSMMVTASVASTATAETLITVTKSLGLAATTTGSSNTITTGKRFRIQSIVASARNSTGTVTSNVSIKLRAAVAGATTASSPLQLTSTVNLPASTASVLFPPILIPDGFEIDSNGATNTWGITITHPQWVTGTQVATFDITLIGYEY